MVRKKRAAKADARDGKSVLKPPSAKRLEEIVEEIVHSHLRPWKRPRSEAEVAAGVRHELDMLLKLVPMELKLDDRAHNRTHAQQLDGALAEVETLLASAPGMLAWFLFSPTPRTAVMKDGKVVETLPPSIEEIERAYQGRAKSFTAELNRLRKVCARAAGLGFGSHPNYAPAKNTCAWFARGLLLNLSRREITGTADDAFQSIASLLYEGVSGQPNASLKRACDSVLRKTKPD